MKGMEQHVHLTLIKQIEHGHRGFVARDTGTFQEKCEFFTFIL
jgi:hypothetical protein